MAIRNTSLGGTNWANGEVLYAVTDLNDTFDAAATYSEYFTPWTPMSKINVSGNSTAGFVAFSSTTWVAILLSASNSRRTTDGGATWSSVSLTNAATEIVRVPGSSTHAICYNTASTTLDYTSNAGASWSAGTMAAGFTTIRTIVAPTTTRAIAVGVPSAGRAVAYSTDNGATWTKSTTGPTVTVHIVCMWDANTGFLIDSSNNIWKTTNGGVDWTDTTHDATAGTESTAGANKMIALSSSTFIHSLRSSGQTYYYDGAANTTVLLIANIGTTSSAGVLVNFVKTSNSYIYFAMTAGATGATAMGVLLRSKDNGVTWQSRTITIPGLSSGNGYFMDQYDTNKLAICGRDGANVFLFDESRE